MIPTLTNLPIKGIVTLCGSHRFKYAFEEIAEYLGTHYWIVLRPAFYSDAQKLPDNSPKSALDRVHLAKIDLSEAIIVINSVIKDGIETYIGESTIREIAYARQEQRKVIWLSCITRMLDDGTFQPKDLTFKEWDYRYNPK